MKIPTLHLDTSVIGGYFDDGWKGATRELWQQMRAGKVRFITSNVTLDEINAAPEKVRGLFASTFPPEDMLDPDDESETLAAASVEHHVLPPKFTDDARHVAICTVAGIELLVSWNFRHLVNVEREKGFNAVNRSIVPCSISSEGIGAQCRGTASRRN
jgi:hypothetical protein